LGVVLAFAACGNMNRVPRYNVGEPLTIEPFKRYTEHDSVDYLYTWKSDAYSQVTEPLKQNLSESQRDVLARHGQPDYTREGWRSESNEIVDEWIYWDRQVIVQFVQNQLVYEGEVTDMDGYRLRYGYPDRSWSQIYETGVRRDFWDYKGQFLKTDGLMVSFTNGSLVSENTY